MDIKSRTIHNILSDKITSYFLIMRTVCKNIQIVKCVKGYNRIWPIRADLKNQKTIKS